MIKEAIVQAASRKHLSFAQAEEVMHEIMEGKVSDIQMAAYLTALSVKGETIDEITASAAGMRKHCLRVLHDMNVLEIVGTGGDKSNSFNISTASAFVVSALGIPLAKHGNRAASSNCGAADVLESLGAQINIPPEQSLHILKTINFCFLFAQNYHISMKYVSPVRKELGIRTIFNMLGPLVNPAGANMELLGVYDSEYLEPMAKVLMNLGVKRGMVVFGQDGLDEISMSSETNICEFKDGFLKSYSISPEQFNLTRCKKEELEGGTPKENAQIIREIFSGNKNENFLAKRNAVLINSAAAIHIAKPEIPIDEGIAMSANAIDSGIVQNQLEQFICLTNENFSQQNFAGKKA
jgi:anthranilate phosphoribosyltransferase